MQSWINSWEGFDVSTLEEAVNHELLMRELMNSQSAVDYMITNNNIINKIVTSDVAMTELGKSEYASSKIIGNKELFDMILNSEHIEKFNISRNIIPQLTSNTSDKGEASYTGTYYYPAYYAFDRLDNTSWGASSLGTVQFKFNKIQYAYMVSLYLKSNAGLTSLSSQFNGTVKLLLNNEEVYSSGEQKIKLGEELKINLDKTIKFDTIVFTQNTTIATDGAPWSGLTEMKVYGILADYENKVLDNLQQRNIDKDGIITTNDKNLQSWINNWEGIDMSSLDKAVNYELLMRELMNSQSAVDYMITNNNIINKVTTSDVAMTELGKSEYASSKIIGNKELLDMILNSEHIEKFNISRNIIPQLTSNTSDKGEASYTGTYYYPAYYAFDRLDNTSWGASSLGTVQFKFNKIQYAYMVSLYLKSNAGLASLSGQFNGTVKLLLNNEEVYSSGEQKIKLGEEFKIDLVNSIQFDTIVFTQNTTISSGGAPWSGLTEMKVYGSEKY